MGDLEALVATLRDLEARSAPSEAEPVVLSDPRSGEALPRALEITRSVAATAVGETLLVIFATACGVAALAFAWLLLRP